MDTDLALMIIMTGYCLFAVGVGYKWGKMDGIAQRNREVFGNRFDFEDKDDD